MSCSNNPKLDTSRTPTKAVIDEKLNRPNILLHLGFTKLNCQSRIRYKCLICSKCYGGKDFNGLQTKCQIHLSVEHKVLKKKKLKFWEVLLESKSKTKASPIPKLNPEEFLHGVCYAIGRTGYPTNVYNNIIEGIFKISGHPNIAGLILPNDAIQNGIDQLESNLKQQIVDGVKAANYYYLKLLTVRGTNAIFVNFFANNKLYEELLFVGNQETNSEFYCFMNKNQISWKKCVGICYYKGSKWINHIKEVVRTIPAISFTKINLNIYDLLANTRLFNFFASLIARINEFKVIESNFVLLQTDLTEHESELLRCTNHDWPNVSKILCNFFKSRQHFILKTLSGDEIVYCAFFCEVSKRLEEFRNDCNSKNSLDLQYAIQKIIDIFECDARLIESNSQNYTVNTYLRAETGPNYIRVQNTLTECLKEISKNCKLKYYDDTYDWIRNPFDEKNHALAPNDLRCLFPYLKADCTLERQFNAIEDRTVTNILKFWNDIDNPKHKQCILLQKLALEKLLLQYNTNIYDKINKICFEAKSRKLQDWHLRVKLSQFMVVKGKETPNGTIGKE